MCELAERLHAVYVDALNAFHECQNPILAGVAPDDPRYPKVRELREHAYAALLKARRMYWDHVHQHQCRGRVPLTSEPRQAAPKAKMGRAELEVAWSQRVAKAWNDYMECTEATRSFEEFQANTPSPDGSYAIVNAQREEHDALREYARILRIYTDLVIQGKMPREDA